MKTAKTRQEPDRHIATPPRGLRGGMRRAKCRGSRGSEHAPTTSPHTSCLWCHLFPPGLLPLNGFPEAARSPCRTRSGQPSALPTLDLLPALPHPHPVFLTGPPIPKMTLRLSGGPFFTGHLLLQQMRTAVNPT